MRVLFVVESGTDVRLVEGLAERVDLEILARRFKSGMEVSQPLERKVPVEVGPMGRAAFAAVVLDRLLRGRARPDVVLVQGYAAAALVANVAGRALGVPVLMLICSPVETYYRCRQQVSGGPPFRRSELAALLAFARANARVAQAYVVLSEHLADLVRSHGTRAPVHRIPVYGVDTRVFSPSREPRRELRAKLGLPTEGPLLFFSSRVAPEKDVATLLQALELLAAEGVPFHLLHRSGGYRQFAELAARSGLSRHVTATDAVHPHGGLAADYRASDVVVQASRAEGLGFSVLEALACETTVVAAAVGGLRETIRDGETGWTYPPGDAPALARAIRAAVADPREALRRARAGREMVSRSYERARAFDDLDALMRESLAARRAR